MIGSSVTPLIKGETRLSQLSEANFVDAQGVQVPGGLEVACGAAEVDALAEAVGVHDVVGVWLPGAGGNDDYVGLAMTQGSKISPDKTMVDATKVTVSGPVTDGLPGSKTRS
jgi:hypothetical protein